MSKEPKPYIIISHRKMRDFFKCTASDVEEARSKARYFSTKNDSDVEYIYVLSEVVCRPTKPAPDAGDSAASSGIINASANTTSQTEHKPTQRG